MMISAKIIISLCLTILFRIVYILFIYPRSDRNDINRYIFHIGKNASIVIVIINIMMAVYSFQALHCYGIAIESFNTLFGIFVLIIYIFLVFLILQMFAELLGAPDNIAYDSNYSKLGSKLITKMTFKEFINYYNKNKDEYTISNNGIVFVGDHYDCEYIIYFKNPIDRIRLSKLKKSIPYNDFKKEKS